MRKTKIFQSYGLPLIIAACVVGSSILLFPRWSDDLVTRTLLGHAESSARSWQTELAEALQEDGSLFDQGSKSEEQLGLINASMAGSDIFRFKAFDMSGRLTFVSDEDVSALEDEANLNTTAALVVSTGEMHVSVEDGTEKPSRPDQYVEAYLPFIGQDGAVQGVIEVYVDVTGLAAAIKAKFGRLSALLIGVTAMIYLIPTFILIRRTAQLRARDRELLKVSRHDALTGLLNRGAFNEACSEFFGPRNRASDGLGILFIDLDFFKDVNDTMGHDIGDRLLKHVADRFRRVCRKEDIIARVGGDEFVILCPCTNPTELRSTAERLISETRDRFICNGTEIPVSFSVGAHVSTGDENERRALYCSDLALYRAKADGRGRVALFSEELERQDIRRRSVLEDVRNGLDQGRFYLEFQPIYNRTGSLAGFESLLRLRAHNGELIPPDEFIPIAEESGLIEDLGLWVMRNAIETAVEWPEDVFVSFNVSAHQFKSGQLVPELDSATRTAGLDPSRVCVELTERVLLEEHDDVAEQLAAIKGLGTQIAIDDFGTGYSSLSYLWRFEFNHLKIDRSFFEAYEFDSVRYARLIETIVALGQQLDMSVTIEGVENQDQMDYILTTTCDHLQGFFLGRPASRERALALSRDTAAA